MKLNSSLYAPLASLLVLAVLAGGALLYAHDKANTVIKDDGANVSDYTAVFLANNQIYFGKEYPHDGNVIDLRDIYYLTVGQQLQTTGAASPSPAATAQPNISLVKLGNELHGPTDRMLINRDQVLFTESLKSDSKVVAAINNYKN